MVFIFLASAIMSIFCFSFIMIYCLSYTATINFLSFGGLYWPLSMDFNTVTSLIFLMLLICFIYVISYSDHYFNGGEPAAGLNKIICVFVSVMASLVITGDFLFTLVMWEYLGVVSFFLILFYGSYLSLRASVITLVSSRFGDVCLFIMICLSGYSINSGFLMFLVFFFIILTKSASFPFISWLLEAMRAPTPVSSLVHSSTLVAAGVWFSIRYDILLYTEGIYIFIVLLLLTIFITGVCSFFFIDLKKIVALSTCNNVAWCILYLIFGDLLLSLFQLVSHGVSKCMLFMLVGDVMSGTGGSQASNCVYSPRLYNNSGVFGLFAVVLGLSGTPFIGVFFTKHFLLINFMGICNISIVIFVLVCVFLSYLYSFRLCSVIINLGSSTASGVLYWFNSGLMPYFWLFINYFISFSLDESASLSYSISLNLLLFQTISCFSAYYFYNLGILRSWCDSLFGNDNLVSLVYELFINLTGLISLFFYRWDNYTINLFIGGGSAAINTYLINFLNIIVMAVMTYLICYCIIYN